MIREFLSFLQAATLLIVVSPAVPAQNPKHGVVRPLSEVKFEKDADVNCLTSALESGNPDIGASTFILKAASGCVVAWHYHTAEEQLIVVRGIVLAEMESVSPRALGPGGFAMMPGKERHQFSCKSESGCIMLVTFDRAYDIFWVKESQSSNSPSE